MTDRPTLENVAVTSSTQLNEPAYIYGMQYGQRSMGQTLLYRSQGHRPSVRFKLFAVGQLRYFPLVLEENDGRRMRTVLWSVQLNSGETNLLSASCCGLSCHWFPEDNNLLAFM